MFYFYSSDRYKHIWGFLVLIFYHDELKFYCVKYFFFFFWWNKLIYFHAWSEREAQEERLFVIL